MIIKAKGFFLIIVFFFLLFSPFERCCENELGFIKKCHWKAELKGVHKTYEVFVSAQTPLCTRWFDFVYGLYKRFFFFFLLNDGSENLGMSVLSLIETWLLKNDALQKLFEG